MQNHRTVNCALQHYLCMRKTICETPDGDFAQKAASAYSEKKHWISLHIAHVGPTIMMSRGHHMSWLVDFLGKTLLLFPDESLSDFVTGDFNQCK